MRVGIDMLGLQSDDSRLRGVGRFGRHFLAALLAQSPNDSYIFYAHEHLPTDQFPDAPGVKVVPLRPEPELGERTMADALERVANSNPDRLDALLTINPFELTSCYAPPAKPLNNLVMIAVVHDLIPFLFQEQYLSDPPGARRAYRHLERLRRYDLLLANSESTRFDCLRVLGLPREKVVTVGAAADGRYFTSDRTIPLTGKTRAALAGLGIHRPFVFAVTGMDERKNARGLIEAFGLLPVEYRETLQLVMTCGITQDYTQRLRSFAEHCGVAGQLVLTGMVSDETLRELYRRCELFAFPSLYEGFGLPILEAMHCGAAVLAGNNSSQIELVEGAGLLVNAADTADIAEKMLRVLRDHELAESMRARAFERARSYSWEKTAAKAIEAIHEVVHVPSVRRIRAERSHRPKLAIFSPWPPKGSGISDYAARLVEELLSTYDIDIYHESGYVPEFGLRTSRLGCFDWRLFPRNARVIGYRGVVHQMGNSFYHRFVYEALQRHRGITALHDFCLSGFQFWYAHQFGDPEGYLRREITYCYPESDAEFHAQLTRWAQEDGGFQEALARRGLFMNRRVFESSEAVIVHSPWCLEQVRREFPGHEAKTVVIPHGSTATRVSEAERAETRLRFGLPQDAFIVASFGILSQGKMNIEALDAFRVLAQRDPRALFLFVGQDWENGQARRKVQELGLEARVRFLGRQPAERFEALLAVADLGISLRRPPTYGETSGALLHLLRHGIPTIVTDVGTFADYPDNVVRKVRWDAEGQDRLTRALCELADDRATRVSLGRAAHQYVAGKHAWPIAASMYAELIERVYREKNRSAPARTLRIPVRN